jgi:hypothetical protein
MEMQAPPNAYFNTYQLPILLELYSDPNSDLYMERSTRLLHKLAQKDGRLHGISVEAIKHFKSHVEELSRLKTARILKPWEKRYSYRRYRSFSPRSMLTGDLAFLDSMDLKSQGLPAHYDNNNLRSTNRGKHICFC